MACNKHDADYLASLEEAYPLDKIEREAKEMTERAELARIEKSDRYVEVASDGSLPSCSIGTAIADMKCAETWPFVESEPTLIINPYRFEVPHAIRVIQTPTKGGAYNCRKPKYKTKKRR